MSLPSNIIEQRPDIRAAEEQLRSANAQVGVAIAAMIPQFTISGAVGGTATAFPWLFRSGGPFWNLIGDVTQPVFAGGTLLHTKRAADEALRQAAAQYQNTVLQAYQNVADTLHALVADGDALAAAAEAERAAKATLESDAPTDAGRLYRLSHRSCRGDRISTSGARPRAGAGDSLRRYCSALPGSRRRMVESSTALASSDGRRPGFRGTPQQIEEQLVVVSPSKQILCIEDEAETAALIAEDLEERGYTVNIATDGHAGLNAILKTSPDLVLCDINMPGMSGFEVMDTVDRARAAVRSHALHFPHGAQGSRK